MKRNCLFGEPIFFNGEYKEDKVYDLYIQMITCSFELKENKIPTIQIKNNVTGDYKNVMLSMENDIVDLVLEVAQKVVAKEVENTEYILGIVADAIDKSVSKKDTLLKVSEHDYDFIIKNKDKMLLNIEGFGEVEIQKEVSLPNGSCVVETKFGIIDGGVETRMKQIEKEVIKILNR